MIAVVLALLAFAAWWLSRDDNNPKTGSFSTIGYSCFTPGKAVSLGLGDILIFKTPENHYGAIRFNKMTNDWGVDYSSWFMPSGEANQAFQSSAEYKGHVAEPDKCNIQCGSLTLRWSGARYIYFPKQYSVTFVEKKSINDVDVLDKSLEWMVVPFYKSDKKAPTRESS